MPQLTDNALEVLRKRYLMKNEEGEIIETPVQMFQRVSDHIASCEKNEKDQTTWSFIFFEVMRKLEFLPNSPTLRNAGANQGSLSACFYLDIEDSRESIF
jgi:ribonucleoside-diphosphate reductase alpha chain